MTKALEVAKFGRESAPAGTVVGDSDTQTLSAKTFSDGPVFSGLNANGVPFLNASKVLSSSSTFVFDGTNLGIGKASPAYKLDVAGNIAARFENPDTGGIIIQATTGTNPAAMTFTNTGGNAYLGLDNSVGNRIGNAAYSLNMWHEGAYPLCFGNSNTERMRIVSGGNIGVGIQAPTAIFHTQSSGLGDGGGIKIGNSGAGGGTFAIWPTATINGEGANKLIFSGSGGNLITIAGSGNVGIGDTSPTYKLDVNGEVRITTGLRITAVTSTLYATDGALSRYNATNNGVYLNGNDAGWLALQASGSQKTYINLYGSTEATTPNDINFVTNSVERVRIKSGGNVGIGTLNPNDKLTVWTTAATGLQTALRLNNPFGFANQNTGTQIIFSQDRTTAEDLKQGIIAVGQNDPGTSATSYMSFYTNNTGLAERLRIDHVGRIIINANQSSNYPAMLDIYGGGGSSTLGAIRIGDGTYSSGHVNYWDIGRDNNVSGDFTFSLNASEKMRIQTNGNVAIGDTTAGSYKLKVVGTLGIIGPAIISSYLSVGSIVANDPGAGYYAYNNRIGGNLAIVGNTYTVGDTDVYKDFTANTGWVRSTVRNGTKAAFTGVYRVAGNGISSPGLFAHNSDLNAWDDLYINCHDDGSGGVGGGTANKIIMGGRVGIGVTTPAYPLHVNGPPKMTNSGFNFNSIDKDASSGTVSFTYGEIGGGMDNMSAFIMIHIYHSTSAVPGKSAIWLGTRQAARGSGGTVTQISTTKENVTTLTVTTNNSDGTVITTDGGANLRCRLTVLAGGGTSVPQY